MWVVYLSDLTGVACVRACACVYALVLCICVCCVRVRDVCTHAHAHAIVRGMWKCGYTKAEGQGEGGEGGCGRRI